MDSAPQCRETPGHETIATHIFDKLARQPSNWASGPEIECPESHAPYQPYREVRGVLKNGVKVRAVKYYGRPTDDT